MDVQTFRELMLRNPNGRRFLDKIEFTSSCWVWCAAKTEFGYGRFRYGGRIWKAHKLAYTITIGQVEEGKELDHFECDTPACVRPSHLKEVTHKQNVARALRHKKVCKRGHPLVRDPYKPGGMRCFVCQAEKRKEYERRNRKRINRRTNEYRARTGRVRKPRVQAKG